MRLGRRSLLVASIVLPMLAARPALAIRPFVTDDARVVGGKLAQLETWVLLDGSGFEHSALGAIGPTDWLELTLGVIHGAPYARPARDHQLTAPLLQAKVLFLPAHDDSWPGVALTAGVIPAAGDPTFLDPGRVLFGYLALTESLRQEWLLLHANLGVTRGPAVPGGARTHSVVTAGFGFQLRVLGGFHAVAELYRGDPYAPEQTAPATQIGFRHIFTDQVQIDGTLGTTLTSAGHTGAVERWGTLGLRLVTPELW